MLTAAFLAGALFPAGAFAQDQLPVVTVAKPVVREIVEDDEFVGRFEAVDEVAIRSRVGGYLDQVHFKDGAIVKKGDLLFTIDQRPYQAASTRRSRSSTSANEPARLRQGATRARRRARKTGNIAVSTLDDRRREYLAARRRSRARTRRCATASLDLEFTEIRAPLAGRIDRRLVSVGNLVQPDQTLADDDRLARSDRLLFRHR